jgi:putative endonuclease
MQYFVDMVARERDGTLYNGVTNDLGRRIWEHKTRVNIGFASCYGVDRLVWYEVYPRIDEAITREKALKKGRRAWKVALIEELNPDWADLYAVLNS